MYKSFLVCFNLISPSIKTRQTNNPKLQTNRQKHPYTQKNSNTLSGIFYQTFPHSRNTGVTSRDKTSTQHYWASSNHDNGLDTAEQGKEGSWESEKQGLMTTEACLRAHVDSRFFRYFLSHRYFPSFPREKLQYHRIHHVVSVSKCWLFHGNWCRYI